MRFLFFVELEHPGYGGMEYFTFLECKEGVY